MHWKLSMCVLLSGFLSTSALGQVRSAPQAAVAPTEASAGDIEAYCHTLLPGDPHSEPLQKACAASLGASRALPNYLCDMTAEKRHSRLDVFQRVSARARVVDGVDSYEDLKINGKRTQDQSALLKGNWSNGELRLKLVAAFEPGAQAHLKYLRSTKVGKFVAHEFSFTVAPENNSTWPWTWEGRTVYPGYQGKILLAESDGRIFELTLKATDGIPEYFPVMYFWSTTKFSYVDFNDGTGLMLPSHVLIQTMMRSRPSVREDVDFRNCRKFAATTRIVPDPSN